MGKKADTTDPVELRCEMWPTTHPLGGTKVNANLDDPLQINTKLKPDTHCFLPSFHQNPCF